MRWFDFAGASGVGGDEKSCSRLYYYGARYYDARTSVFSSIDPDAEKYPAMSPYVYAANNPIRFVDVQGKGPGERLWGLLRALGGAIEMAGGGVLLAAPEPTMLTKIGGVAAVAHGADNFATGITQLWSGKEEISLTQAGLEEIGLSSRQAEIADMVLGIGLGGGGAIAKAERMIRMGKFTRASYHEGLDALKKTGDEM